MQILRTNHTFLDALVKELVANETVSMKNFLRLREEYGIFGAYPPTASEVCQKRLAHFRASMERTMGSRALAESVERPAFAQVAAANGSQVKVEQVQGQ